MVTEGSTLQGESEYDNCTLLDPISGSPLEPLWNRHPYFCLVLIVRFSAPDSGFLIPSPVGSTAGPFLTTCS